MASNTQSGVPAHTDKGSVMDDILTPLERSVKTYLMGAVAKDLIESLALLATERPAEPHLFLAQQLLERGGCLNTYALVRRQVDPQKSKLQQAKHAAAEAGAIEASAVLDRKSRSTATPGTGTIAGGGGAGRAAAAAAVVDSKSE